MQKIHTIAAVLIICQLITILFLSAFIYTKRLVREKATIHPIVKDTMEISQTDELKHFYEPKPNTILRNTPTWLSYQSKNTINSDTLHERFAYSLTRPKDTFRIITVGDSMTFGLYLDTKDNWTELLEDKLNTACSIFRKYEVLNLGVGGYDVRYAVERFIKRGQKYDPDLVLWFILDRNFTTPLDEFYELYDYYNEQAEKNTDSVESRARRAQENLYILRKKNEVIPYQMNSLKKMLKYFDGKLLFFSSATLLSRSLENTLLDTIKGQDRLSFNSNIGNLTDLHMMIRAGDPHPNKKGSELIAEDLFTYLTKQGLAPCS